MSETITINATKDQILEFKESILWKDIVNELESWLLGFKQEQDAIVDDAAANNPSTAAVLLHLGDINGRQKAVNYMIGILDVFLSIKEEQKQHKTNEEVS